MMDDVFPYVLAVVGMISGAIASVAGFGIGSMQVLVRINERAFKRIVSAVILLLGVWMLSQVGGG